MDPQGKLHVPTLDLGILTPPLLAAAPADALCIAASCSTVSNWPSAAGLDPSCTVPASTSCTSSRIATAALQTSNHGSVV
jgi:hypothetical protein